MSGRFIAIVGPSGVGKDSVMQAMAQADPSLHLARRLITRSSDAGGEDFEGVSRAEFGARRDAGAFALWWQAHGLCYGIPAEVDTLLEAGTDVIANLSRSVLEQALKRFERCEICLLTASIDVLQSRLEHRAREDRVEITKRLERAHYKMPDHLNAHILENSGPLSRTVQQAFEVLNLSQPKPNELQTGAFPRSAPIK